MRIAPLALASLFVSHAAFAQEIDVPFSKFTLDNGLEVIVHEDHSDPVVAVYVYYHVGSAREELGKSGYAHLFEHMLFQGSEHVGDDMHFKYVTEAGGTLNGTTNTDRTNYFETLPSNQLELALWLESDRMGFLLPALTKEKLDNQIDVVKNERRQNYENRPYAQAGAAIAAALYPKEHPYSWLTIGSHEDLTKASLDDIKGFFRRWYGPNNATLAIGGDVSTADVRALAEKYFGSIPRGPAVDCPTPLPVALTESKRLVLEDKVKLPQIIVTWPSVPQFHEDEPALDYLAAILSSNKSSVLTKALTIDEQLASSVNAASDTSELAGTFSITLRVQKGVSLDKLEDRMNELLVELSKKGVDEAALARAIQRYRSDFVRRLETVSSRTSTLANYNAFLKRPDYYKEDLTRRTKVTAADVTRVLNRYVLGKPMIAMSVVPDGQKQLAASDKPLPPAAASAAAVETAKKPAAVAPEAKKEVAAKNESAPKPAAETATIDRSKKPAPQATPAFRSPALWHQKLANGMSLSGTPWKELPISTLSITVPAGRSRETMKNLGLSSLVAAMLQQGTQSLTAVAFAEELDRLGANLSVGAGDDEISIRLTCLDAQLPEAVKLLSDVILRPRLDAADFARLKLERTTALDTRADQIRTIASDVYNRLLYGDEAVVGRSAIGTKATVAAMTLDDVKTFWKTFGVPADARASYVGSLGASALGKLLAPLVDGWKGTAPAAAKPAAIPAIASTKLYLVDKPGAAQSEVRIGHMGPSSKDADFFALTVLNWPLGGSFTSRINLNLREQKGYTYGARSGFDGGLEPGPFTASGGVKTDVTAESVVEFMKELEGIGGGMTAGELTFTRDSMGQAARRQYEATAALLGLVESVGKYGWPDDFPAKHLQELDTMKLERLKQLSEHWIHPKNMVILVVGDKKTIAAKLAKLGYGDPIELDVDGNRIANGG